MYCLTGIYFLINPLGWIHDERIAFYWMFWNVQYTCTVIGNFHRHRNQVIWAIPERKLFCVGIPFVLNRSANGSFVQVFCSVERRVHKINIVNIKRSTSSAANAQWKQRMDHCSLEPTCTTVTHSSLVTFYCVKIIDLGSV